MSINHTFLAYDIFGLDIYILILLSVLNMSIPSKILLYIFNRYIFYTLFNVFAHIWNYPENKKCVLLYINIMK